MENKRLELLVERYGRIPGRDFYIKELEAAIKNLREKVALQGISDPKGTDIEGKTNREILIEFVEANAKRINPLWFKTFLWLLDTMDQKIKAAK